MNWKEHPTIIPATAFFSGLVGATIFFYSYILPVMTKDEQNAIADQNRQISDLRSGIDDKKSLIEAKDKKIAVLTGQIGSLQNKIGALELDKLVSRDDLYPISFRSIRIGSTVNAINEQYDKSVTEVHKNYISIKTDDKLFVDATYYIEPCKVPLVTDIMFFLRDSKQINSILERYKQNAAPKSLNKIKYEDDSSVYYSTPPVSGAYVELKVPENEYGFATLHIFPANDKFSCKTRDGSEISIVMHGNQTIEK